MCWLVRPYLYDIYTVARTFVYIATTGSVGRGERNCSWNSDSQLNIHTVSERAESTLQSASLARLVLFPVFRWSFAKCEKDGWSGPSNSMA